MPTCFTADLWIFYCEELNCWRLTNPGEERHKVITESDKDRLAEVWHLFEKETVWSGGRTRKESEPCGQQSKCVTSCQT